MSSNDASHNDSVAPPITMRFPDCCRWSKLSPLQRSKHMYKFAEVLSERSEGLQNKLSMNTGLSDCAEELDNCVRAAFKWAGSCGTDAGNVVSYRIHAGMWGVQRFSSPRP